MGNGARSSCLGPGGLLFQLTHTIPPIHPGDTQQARYAKSQRHPLQVAIRYNTKRTPDLRFECFLSIIQGGCPSHRGADLLVRLWI